MSQPKLDGKEEEMSKSHKTTDPLLKYVNDHSLRLHPMQTKLIEITCSKDPKRNRILSSADEIQFLANLVKYMGFKKTLDIGVYTGYSAMSIALALPEDGKVIACDISDKYPAIGKPVWKEAGVDHKIDLRICPAVETLQELLQAGNAGTFDFAFIDADKDNYENYYEMCLKLLRPGGLIAIDNVLWKGHVYDDSFQDDNTLAIRAINDKVIKDERVDVNMLTVGDGTTLAFKKY